MEVNLKRNGWHRKLQTFVFKNAPRYNSLCPYFWFTVFCAIFTFIIPIVPFIKLIKGIFWVAGWILKGINNKICIPMMNSIIRGMDDSDVITSWTAWNQSYTSADYGWKYNSQGEATGMTQEEKEDWNFWRNDFTKLPETSSRFRERSRKRFEKWKAATPDWEAQIELIKQKRRDEYKAKIQAMNIAAKERQLREYEKEKAAAEKLRIKKEKEAIYAMQNAERIAAAKKRREAIFTKIVLYTKWIAYVLVAGILSLIGYGIYKLFSWIATCNIPWTKIGSVTLIVCEIALAAAVAIAVIYLLVKLVQKCEIRPSDSKTLRAIGRFFIWIGRGLAWFGIKVLAPIGLFLYKWVILPLAAVMFGIYKVFAFIGMYLKSTKDGYCPAIIWKDDESVKE